MKQEVLKELDEGLGFRVDFYHHATGTWLLKSCISHQRDGVQECLRLTRMYQRMQWELKTDPSGKHADYSAVRLRIAGVTIAEAQRTAWPEFIAPAPLKQVKPPKEKKPARKPSAKSATAPATSESKSTDKSSGGATITQLKPSRPPRKTV